MEMAAGAISVEDYEEAGLVLSTAELVELTEKTTVSELKGKQPQGIIANKGGDDTPPQPPKIATDNGVGDEKKGKTEWEIEMEMEMKKEDEWPGPWEFERDEFYFHWIFYCPDAFLLHYHQLPNYI